VLPGALRCSDFRIQKYPGVRLTVSPPLSAITAPPITTLTLSSNLHQSFSLSPLSASPDLLCLCSPRPLLCVHSAQVRHLLFSRGLKFGASWRAPLPKDSNVPGRQLAIFPPVSLSAADSPSSAVCLLFHCPRWTRFLFFGLTSNFSYSVQVCHLSRVRVNKVVSGVTTP